MKIVSFIQHFVFVNFNLIVRETGCDIQMGDEIFCLVLRRLSLSMKVCAQRKAGRRKRASTSLVSPSHGPLRFVTGHWRFAFASMWKNYEAPEKEEDLSPSSDLVLDRTDKNQYVVAEFYPWSKFYFLLFTKSYNTPSPPPARPQRQKMVRGKKISTKDKTEPQKIHLSTSIL